MRDSAIPARSASQAPPPSASLTDLHHLGILRLLDRCGAQTLRDWLTLRCFLDATRSFSDDGTPTDAAITQWLAHALRDRHGAPLMPRRPTFESRHLLSQLVAALTAPANARSVRDAAIAARVRRNFLSRPPPASTTPRDLTPDALDAALRSLTAAFAHHAAVLRDAASHPDMADAADADVPPMPSSRPAPDLAAIGDSRSVAELFVAWRAALACATGPVSVPAGPIDIVSTLGRGDLRVVRTRPTDPHPRLELTFPSPPPRTLTIALPPPLARRLPAFCNPLGPLEHDALRAELRHLPACRAVLDDDERRARLYWSAAARYAQPPPRRVASRRARPWRAAMLRGMVLAAAWSGASRPAAHREPASPGPDSQTWLAVRWAACQQWWHAVATPLAIAQAATPEDGAFGENAASHEPVPFDTPDASPGPPGSAEGTAETEETEEMEEMEEMEGEDGEETEEADAQSRFRFPALPWNDDAVTLLWSHVSPGERRDIVAGARRFALNAPAPNAAHGVRDDDALRRLNEDGWYVYSNLPAILLICEKVLDDRHGWNQTAFHALLGDIGRAAARGRPSHVVCFEDRRNQSLAWRVDTTAAPGSDITAVDTAPANATDADAVPSAVEAPPDALRREAGGRLALKQILALLARTNDPPFELDALLCAMIEAKHRVDGDIARHAERTVAEIRASVRRVALTRLVAINQRDFPSRRVAPGEITTPGAKRFVDLLLHLLDPVLQAAPDALAYGGEEMFHARFGHYFAERNRQPGASRAHWAAITSQGRHYVKGWCVLTRDERYMAAMNAENPALVRHLQSLFANEIARSAWLFRTVRMGPPLARSTIARQFLLDAGIPPEQRIQHRRFITLDEARAQHALLRKFDNSTFLEVYMAIDNGLERLREAEPRYRALLPDRALAGLPSRRDVIAYFDKAFEDKIATVRRSSRAAIESGFAASPAAIRQDVLSAARLRLHLHRPLSTEKSLLAEHIASLDDDTHRYQRHILGHSTGAILETVGAAGPSRFYLFDVEGFTVDNRTTMLTPLPALRDAGDAGRYMARHPGQFFATRFPSIYDEAVYYKNDVTPHLVYDCGGLGAVWEKWIDFRLAHQAWRKRALRETIGVERMQDDPLALYIEMLPFHTCQSAWQARALTLDLVLDSVFCLLDFTGLRHVLKPMRTWIAHSAAVDFIEKRLAWYESLRRRSSLDSRVIGQRIEALRVARRSVEDVRRRRSTHEVATAFRKISHFPFTGSASAGYHLYKATQAMVEIGIRIRPFTVEGRESPMQRFLRWQSRNKLWEADIRGMPSAQSSHPGRETIVGELRHADEHALPYRLRDATCSPHVCTATCLFDSLASMSTRRRMRILVKLLDGVAPQKIYRQSVRHGFLLTSDVLRELTQLAADLGPLRGKFAAVRDSDFAPPARRRKVLSQVLLHPYANTTAHARLHALPAYRALTDDLYALNFFFESPLQQLAQTLDAPREPETSCLAPADEATPPPRPAAMPEAPSSGTTPAIEPHATCTRPGEDNEIRTCLLPIVPCAEQRAQPVGTVDEAGHPEATSG